MKELIRKIVEFFLPFRVNKPLKRVCEIDSSITMKIPKFRVGDRIISINNEDEPYRVGTIVRYQPITKSHQLIPIVKFDNDDEEYICMSHLEPYSEELCSKLDELDNISQWNYCVHDYCQIKQKGGAKAQTFECQCDSCQKIRRNKS